MQHLKTMLFGGVHATARIQRRRLRLLGVLGACIVALLLTAGVQGASTPALTLSPTSLTFASQATGTTSAPQTITATNTGTASLFFNNVATSGETLDFTLVDDQCIGTTLAPGASCTVSVTFSPTTTGTRTATVNYTDNAPNSPQTVTLTGGGTGTAAPLAIMTQFYTCANGVCDVNNGVGVIVNNFYSATFQASGGTPPYTWSGQVPAGLTLHSTGLVLGDPTSLGTQTFQLTVKDAAGNTATGSFSLTGVNAPAPSPGGACQTYGTLRESLSGSPIGGRTPSGTATADETKLSGCGGFGLLSVQVKNVNVPDGTVLWVTLDGLPVGTITLKGGSGTMPQYNMGDFGVSRDSVQVHNSLPDASPFQQILSGARFS